MRELALNVLDVAENSLRANAKQIVIEVEASMETIRISITDDGCGMDEEFLSRVTDPFTTTRTTRRVGMGLSLLQMEAEMAGGSFEIASEQGKGTKVVATFRTDHIDRPPLGNFGDTLAALLPDLGETELIFTYRAFGKAYTLDTEEIKRQLEGVPLDTPEILVFIREMTDENVTRINGGIEL